MTNHPNRSKQQQAKHTPGPQQVHTPGPWKAMVGPVTVNVTTEEKPRSRNICSVSLDRKEHAANARLIAAAPELLRVVEMLLSGDYGRLVPADLAEAARAAIAKAEGR